VGNTSRTMEFEARKVVQARPEVGPSAADLLSDPLVVCRARGVCVVPATLQRL
jgi:3-aminobutyryl-CoA ammonia-lyase